jgi:hypothetical protein
MVADPQGVEAHRLDPPRPLEEHGPGGILQDHDPERRIRPHATSAPDLRAAHRGIIACDSRPSTKIERLATRGSLWCETGELLAATGTIASHRGGNVVITMDRYEGDPPED